MEEDVLGPRQTVVGSLYDRCARCGALVLRAHAAIPRVAGDGPPALPNVPEAPRPLEATQDEPPLFLCPTCAREVAAGEPLEPPDEAETGQT